jgi:TolB-like protein
MSMINFIFRSSHIYLILLIIFISTAGCARFGYERVAYGQCGERMQSGDCFTSQGDEANLLQLNFDAADRLIRAANLSNRLKNRHRFVITTLADVNDLSESTALGRLISEQITERFVQNHYDVFDARLHSRLMVSDEGEFVLSRELREIGRAQKAEFLIAGTYAVGETQVYVTLKMLSFVNGKILASQAYSLPKDANIRALLKKYLWW